MSTTLEPDAAPKARTALWKRLAPWAITIVCFGYLYFRIGAAAGPDQSVLTYLAGIFASVNWLHWLALMVPYSFLYLLIDTMVLWRVVNWFNTRVSLPGSAPGARQRLHHLDRERTGGKGRHRRLPQSA